MREKDRMKITNWVALAVAALWAAACTIRLGGPAPVEYRTVGWEIPAGVAPSDAAAVLRSHEARMSLLIAREDSAWFTQVAEALGQTLSGPAQAGPVRLAFLGAEPLGDTTVVLPVDNGNELIVHDALYRVDDYRYLDLMAFHLERGANVREAVRSLLRYMATDVMVEAAVVLAVSVPDPVVGDSVAALLRPHLTDAMRCSERSESPDAGSGATSNAAPPDATSNLRLFFGPEARAYCVGSELLAQPNRPVLARVVVER